MPVTEGSGSGQWPTTIQHVSNGEPASETVLRRPSIDLENRTLAVRTFTEAQETLRDTQIGDSDSAIGGLQGTFNTTHAHDGSGSSLIDLQQAYDNGDAAAVVKLEAAGSFDIQDSTSASIIKIDEATKKFVGTDIIGSAEIDWGTGTDQVSADDVPSGAVNRIVTQVEYTALNDHLTATDQHSHKYMGFPLQKSNVTATGSSTVVTTEMSGETAGGADGTEGIVTDSSHNYVIIRDTNSDDILDGSGNKVYGRILESGGVWTLYFYSNVAGSETVYSGFSSTTIQWWVQKIYKPSTRPVYSPIFEVSSDQLTAQVNWGALTDSLVPATDGAINLGDDTHRFGDLFLSGDTINLGTGKIKYDTTTQKIQIAHDGSSFGDISTGGGGAVPTGTVLDFAGATPPSGFLACDGSAVSRTTYADLYNVIGVTYGVGDGATTFNVPDSQGRTSIGVGSGSGLTTRNLADTSGTETHSHSHSHTVCHNHRFGCGNVAIGTEGGTYSSYTYNSSGSITKMCACSTECSYGGGGNYGINNSFTYTSFCTPTSSTDNTTGSSMMPFIAFTKIIKA